jgi:hypothetical protein
MDYVYMYRPAEKGDYNCGGLKAGVIYRCCIVKNSGRDLYRGRAKASLWLLTDFEQLSNVEVITLIHSGKVPWEELP